MLINLHIDSDTKITTRRLKTGQIYPIYKEYNTMQSTTMCTARNITSKKLMSRTRTLLPARYSHGLRRRMLLMSESTSKCQEPESHKPESHKPEAKEEPNHNLIRSIAESWKAPQDPMNMDKMIEAFVSMQTNKSLTIPRIFQ